MKLLLTILLLLFAAVPVIEHNEKKMKRNLYIEINYFIYIAMVIDLICIIWVY
jgi:hypothetical protein